MSKKIPVVVLALAVLWCTALVGCGNNRPANGLNSHDQQLSNRLDDIIHKTGGDWNKLTPADRDYLVKDISQGNEESARMLLAAASGRLRRSAGPAGAARPGVPVRGQGGPPPPTGQ